MGAPQCAVQTGRWLPRVCHVWKGGAKSLGVRDGGGWAVGAEAGERGIGSMSAAALARRWRSPGLDSPDTGVSRKRRTNCYLGRRGGQ